MNLVFKEINLKRSKKFPFRIMHELFYNMFIYTILSFV